LKYIRTGASFQRWSQLLEKVIVRDGLEFDRDVWILRLKVVDQLFNNLFARRIIVLPVHNGHGAAGGSRSGTWRGGGLGSGGGLRCRGRARRRRRCAARARNQNYESCENHQQPNQSFATVHGFSSRALADERIIQKNVATKHIGKL